MIAIIFDIDDTLVESGNFDSKLYIRAVKETIGDVFIHNNWKKYKNITDSGILKQIIKENNIPDERKVSLNVRERFGELIMTHLESSPCRPKRGIIDTLNELYMNKDYTIGFATGGWRHTALMKLHSAGVSIDETTLFSSDDHYERIGIMECCKNQIAPSSNDIVYVGDAEWDMEAAMILQWGFIGIGDKLKGKADVWIPGYISEMWKLALINAMQLLKNHRPA